MQGPDMGEGRGGGVCPGGSRGQGSGLSTFQVSGILPEHVIPDGRLGQRISRVSLGSPNAQAQWK